MKKNATDAERVRRLAMRARLAWLTERRSSFAMTTVTAWRLPPGMSDRRDHICGERSSGV